MGLVTNSPKKDRRRYRTPGQIDAVHQSIPVFSPPDLANLQLWFDVSQDPVLPVGSYVSEMPDRSGNGRNATGSGVTRPSYQPAAYGDRAAYWFDGFSSKLVTAYTQSGAFTLFLVEQGLGAQGYARTVNNNTSATGTCISTSSRSFGNNVYVQPNAISQTQFDTVAMQVCLRATGTHMSYYAGGVLINDSVPAAGSLLNISFGAANLSYPTEGANAYLFEFILYSGSLSDANRSLVEDYLRNKYPGIA